MPDRFDATTAALVLIDHQVGTPQLVRTISSALVLTNARRSKSRSMPRAARWKLPA